MNKALIDMTIDRDDHLAGEERQRNRAEYYKTGFYELTKELNDLASLASSADSSSPPGDPARPTVSPLMDAPARANKKMPISLKVSRRRNKMPRTPKPS